MTTTQIATYADKHGDAPADMDLQVLLRRKVIPLFFEDVGYTSWKKRIVTPQIVAPNQSIALAGDATHIKWVSIDPDQKTHLSYIGEDPGKMLAAKANTVAAKPTAWFAEFDSSGYFTLWLDAPVDKTYLFYICKDSGIVFADDTTSVDLTLYIPAQWQWALVEGLKREIYHERFGIGDQRYQRSDAEYKRIVELAQEKKEMGRREAAVFAR